MSNTLQIKTLIDAAITNKEEANSITPAILGDVLKQMFDALKPYKVILARIGISGGTVTPTYIITDFVPQDITMSVPANGVLRVAIAGDVVDSSIYLVSKIFTQGTTGQTVYRLVPAYNQAPGALDINIQEFDGTQNSTPNLFAQLLEIRFYN